MRMIWPAAAGIAVVSLIAIAGSATAQTAAEKAAHETITVFAPYVVRHQPYTPKRGIGRDRLELISVDRPVSFADLDLRNAADQQTLEARVKQAAKDACAELDHRYPKRIYVPVPENQDCVKTATDEAMVLVRDLTIAAAVSLRP